MSAGPLHPSPLSLYPECKSQTQAATASARSYHSAIYCLFHWAISPNLARLSPQDLWRSGFIGWGFLQVHPEKIWAGQVGGHMDLFAVESEEWAAYSTAIFFNCTQLISSWSSAALWSCMGKGHSAASLAAYSQFVLLKRFNSQHKLYRNERTSVALEMSHHAPLTHFKELALVWLNAIAKTQSIMHIDYNIIICSVSNWLSFKLDVPCGTAAIMSFEWQLDSARLRLERLLYAEGMVM